MKIAGGHDLLQSERGVWCVMMALCATALVVTGKLDGHSWLDFMKYITTVIVASKTVTTAVETFATREPQIPPARVVNREDPKPPS